MRGTAPNIGAVLERRDDIGILEGLVQDSIRRYQLMLACIARALMLIIGALVTYGWVAVRCWRWPSRLSVLPRTLASVSTLKRACPCAGLRSLALVGSRC